MATPPRRPAGPTHRMPPLPDTPTPAGAQVGGPAWGPPARTGPSGLLKAGRILLLVGSIVQAVGIGFILLSLASFVTLAEALEDEGEDVPAGVGPFLLLFYGGMAVLLLAGAIVAFVAWRKAQAGDLHKAWILGLVASLLPPVQPVTLIGAILLLTCPEHDAQQAQALRSA